MVDSCQFANINLFLQIKVTLQRKDKHPGGIKKKIQMSVVCCFTACIHKQLDMKPVSINTTYMQRPESMKKSSTQAHTSIPYADKEAGQFKANMPYSENLFKLRIPDRKMVKTVQRS